MVTSTNPQEGGNRFLRTIGTYLTFRGPCIVIYSYNHDLASTQLTLLE